MVIDRRAVEAELNQVFEPAIVQVVVNVLNRVALSAVDVTRADLYDLRVTMHELAQAQLRTEARLEELAQAQARTEARLERVETALERLEAAVMQLVLAQATTEARVKQLEITVGGLKGWALEDHYRRHAGAFFGRHLRRLREVPLTDLEEALETRLTDDELAYLWPLDLLLRGRLAHGPDTDPIWLAVEDIGPGERTRRGARPAAGRAPAPGRLPDHAPGGRGGHHPGCPVPGCNPARAAGLGRADQPVGRSPGGCPGRRMSHSSGCGVDARTCRCIACAAVSGGAARRCFVQ